MNEIKNLNLIMQNGHTTLENTSLIKQMLQDEKKSSIQITINDGKVWININGISALRFYPAIKDNS